MKISMKKSSMMLTGLFTLGIVLLPFQASRASSVTSPCPTDVLVQSGDDYKYSQGETNVPMYTFDICFPRSYQTAYINWVQASLAPNVSTVAGLRSLTASNGNWLALVLHYPSYYTGGNSIYGWYNGLPYPYNPHLVVPAGQWFTVTISGNTVANVAADEAGNVCLIQVNYSSANGSGMLTTTNGGLPADPCSTLIVMN